MKDSNTTAVCLKVKGWTFQAGQATRLTETNRHSHLWSVPSSNQWTWAQQQIHFNAAVSLSGVIKCTSFNPCKIGLADDWAVNTGQRTSRASSSFWGEEDLVVTKTGSWCTLENTGQVFSIQASPLCLSGTSHCYYQVAKNLIPCFVRDRSSIQSASESFDIAWPSVTLSTGSSPDGGVK